MLQTFSSIWSETSMRNRPIGTRSRPGSPVLLRVLKPGIEFLHKPISELFQDGRRVRYWLLRPALQTSELSLWDRTSGLISCFRDDMNLICDVNAEFLDDVNILLFKLFLSCMFHRPKPSSGGTVSTLRTAMMSSLLHSDDIIASQWWHQQDGWLGVFLLRELNH